MGYQLQIEDMKRLFDRWKADYTLLGPRRMAGEGMYSDTDVIRYGELENWEDLEWDQRSHYSFKEAVLPITQILFYFTEETVTEAQAERCKPALIFLRSCDIHAIKRLDEIYLRNRFEDQYYRRLRDNIKLVLMSCPLSCGSGFCVSMGTNRTEDYDAAVSPRSGGRVRYQQVGRAGPGAGAPGSRAGGFSAGLPARFPAGLPGGERREGGDTGTPGQFGDPGAALEGV